MKRRGMHALIISALSCSKMMDGLPVPTGLFSQASMLFCVGLHSIIPKSSPSTPPYCLFWSLGLCGFFYFSDHWPQQESWGSVSQTLDCLPLKSVLLITVLDCSTGKELFMNCQVAAGHADKDYISQPPLQLFMALWLNSSQWDVRRSDIYNFLLVPSKGRDVSSTSSSLPHWLSEQQPSWTMMKKTPVDMAEKSNVKSLHSMEPLQ